MYAERRTEEFKPAQAPAPRLTVVMAGLAFMHFFGYVVNVDTAAGADADYQIVQSYLNEDGAWHRSDKEGARPDITSAVAAAKAIIATPHNPKTADAAMFLMAYPPDASPTAEADVSLGEQALAAFVGPDWSLVEGFDEAVSQGKSEIAAADISRYESMRQVDALSYRPIAAAIAVLNVDDHPKTREAAEFLVNQFRVGRCFTRYVILGAETLRSRFPDYDNWRGTLFLMDSCGRVSSDGAAAVNRFYEALAVDDGADPGVRGIARYFLASGLRRSIDDPANSHEDREALRRSALRWATGLSADAEDVELFLRYGPGNRPGNAPLAQVEKQLIHSIQRGTVGSPIAEVVGKRLDGVEEKLSNYAGKAVLVDFWATWCVPCIANLPALRALHADLSAERFSLLSISVDEHLETVIEFHDNETMPWSNWHVGNASDVARILGVRTYPTYLLLDEQGLILARSSSLNDRFVAAITNTVLGARSRP